MTKVLYVLESSVGESLHKIATIKKCVGLENTQYWTAARTLRAGRLDTGGLKVQAWYERVTLRVRLVRHGGT